MKLNETPFDEQSKNMRLRTLRTFMQNKNFCLFLAEVYHALIGRRIRINFSRENMHEEYFLEMMIFSPKEFGYVSDFTARKNFNILANCGLAHMEILHKPKVRSVYNLSGFAIPFIHELLPEIKSTLEKHHLVHLFAFDFWENQESKNI